MLCPFTAGSTGGKAVSSYLVTSTSGVTASGSSSPIALTETVSGTYTYTVTATNANGTSPASSASNSVVVSLVPNAPTIGTATDAGSGRAYNNGAASVTFTPSGSGPAATSYTVTSSPGGYTGTGASSPRTVTGLQSAPSYTLR
jgi:hypothetical protein